MTLVGVLKKKKKSSNFTGTTTDLITLFEREGAEQEREQHSSQVGWTADGSDFERQLNTRDKRISSAKSFHVERSTE